MSDNNHSTGQQHPPRGQLGYLQIPALDIERSATFYERVFGWQVELTYGSFEAPGLIGQWTTDLAPGRSGGPVLWICADQLAPTLQAVATYGGEVTSPPQLDQGERWLVEIADPAGNRMGVVVVAQPPQPQTMVAVRDVASASRWYQELFGWQSDHGGPDYERLLSSGVLVLQLHNRETEHHHGLIGDPTAEVGNGVLLWFGEVADFDDLVRRADRLGATVLKPPHRNPPSGEGNGPGHREIWLRDLDDYTVVAASPDGEAYEPA